MLGEEGAVLGGQWELRFSPVSQQSSGCPVCPPQSGLVELSGALCVVPFNNQRVKSTKATQVRSK